MALGCSDDDAAASRTLGRYELLRLIAQGGMADVYLARRRAAGVEKLLVVKRLRREASSNPRLLSLFVREARLSMSLVHQNIVPVFDFGRTDDQVFLAMELIDGTDLGLSLARAATHRMPPLVAAFIAAECCQALDYAHRRKGPGGVGLGIVHRDVTPRNVLLSWCGEVKLADFGIAALAGDPASRLLGTPEYMAPEQAHREPIDPRADIYAMGLVLREAVSGVRPRPGSDRHAILGAARRGELLPWSQLPAATPAPDDDDAGDAAAGHARGSGALALPEAAVDVVLPDALIAIIDRATSVSPADRYPDARAMFDDLDGFIVARRAASGCAPPARQLAAWLSAVWDGATGEPAFAAASEDGQAISWVADRAHDTLGAGTVRSLAATADDDGGDAAGPALSPMPAEPWR